MNLHCERQTLAFNRPISVVPGVELTQREQALMSFDFHGERLTGELPALPGYLPLSLDEAWAQALNVHLEASQLPLKLQLTQPFFGLLKSSTPLHSQTLFAFESALLPWVVTQFKLPLMPEKVSSQGLLFAGVDPVPSNQVALKIKVARADLSHDINYCHEVRQKNPLARLRLDPNRELSAAELELLVKLCRELKIDGVEVSATEFRHHSWGDLPLLLDDSWPLNQDLDLSRFSAVVYKPSRDGGLSGLFELNSKVPVTLSSTYESYWGLESMALAARVAQLQGAQGLGTWRFLDGAMPFALQSLAT